jgi:hypothetical protein
MISITEYLHYGGFHGALAVSSTNKTDSHYITEIVLKVALNTMTLPITMLCIVMFAERQAQILLAKLNLSLEKSSSVF